MRPVILAVSILIAALGWAGIRAAENPPSADDEENLPQSVDRGFDLTRLSIFTDPKEPLDPVLATIYYLSFLREEIETPTPPHRGIGGGIDHHYVLAQIIHAGADGNVRRAALLAEAGKAAPGEFRDAVRITLGMQGEKSVVPFLVEYLGNAKNPYWLRVKAAHALLRYPDASAVSVLASCLKDPFYVAVTTMQPAKCYDIRILALSSLRALEKAGTAIPPAVKADMEGAVTRELLPPGAKAISHTQP
ncbi:MAG: HEAT repeat domain-containing protein [Armatimonadetes bacterium]|nr:HEAT repeat domain-containing protein [Armatimonadota bacterium]